MRTEDAEQYLEHQALTGVREYRETPGNLGALVLRRDRRNLVEVTTVSFWSSMEAVQTFAGDEPPDPGCGWPSGEWRAAQGR